jgi:hypothetical protein
MSESDQCLYCRHFKGINCAAFPDGIPSAAREDHLKKLPDQKNDIVFEFADDLTEEDRRYFREVMG